MVNNYIIGSTLFAAIFVTLGFLILSRNSRSPLNRLFMVFSISLACWLVTNYLAGSPTTPQNLALWSNKLVLLFGGTTTLTLLAFAKTITARRWRKIDKLLVIASLPVLTACLTPLIVNEVTLEEGTYVIDFGILALPYFLLLVSNAAIAISELIISRRGAESARRHQVDIILKSFGWGMVGVITTNALLPFAFNYYALTNAGSFFSAFFVAGIAIAIVKHRLFDIRLIVARSLAYTGLITLLAVTYGALTYGISVLILQGQSNQILLGAINVALIVVAAISFAPLKRIFDKFTNTIFYRDAYEAQELLDEFNKALVSTIELKKLIIRTSSVIQTYLKADYCVIGVQKTEDSNRYVEGTSKVEFDKKDLDKFIKLSPNLESVVVATDYLEEHEADLKSLLERNNVSVVARLVNPTPDGDPDIGYIVLGPKKSGNMYNGQDLSLMEILANELVIAIQNALRFEEIEKFNITLREEIETATKQLRQSNEKLKALDETKDEFISMASHQLRTPLTAVKGYLSMVIEGDAGKLNDMQEQLLTQAFTSSQRMVYLIADLLNVSRLKTGKFILEKVETNLADMIEGEIDQLRETAKSRSIDLVYNKPVDFPRLLIDETKTRQVVMNFVDNAIYYGKPNGKIEVHLEEKGKSIEFTVVDDGIGVPKNEQHNLFNKFYRANNAKKARPDGTGLGLFMAKKVIVAQGGAIIFHSEEGKGSTFGFSFEKAKLLPVQITAPSEEPAVTV